jgi:RNA polymerase sigma-70 factor (ECF subfamily)
MGKNDLLGGGGMASGEMTLGSVETLAGTAASETGLVERCRRGDAEAFARLMVLHEGMVFNLAARLLRDAEEARDLSQEVFLQVFRTLGGFEGRSSLRTWIYRIVVNQCRNRQRWWRRRRRGHSLPLQDLTDAQEARLSAAQAEQGPQHELERRDRAREVQAALSALSFDHRAILMLREVEGLSCEEIAQALALPAGTVKSRLARAREALRRRVVAAGNGHCEGGRA